MAEKTTKLMMGKWIIVDDTEYFIARCSECGAAVDSRRLHKLLFCPKCKTKMENTGGLTMEKLKPCKCGSAVELCRGDDDYYIYCPKCKLKTFSDRVYDNITDNCDRLIDVWNGRDSDG